MDRTFEVTKYICKEQRGIEIGPWHTPLAPKAEGYNCLVLDFYDEEYLRETARKIPSIPKEHVERIESVDIRGTAADIEDLVAASGSLGAFDYIISSHNFEHIPNPIKFLQGCSRVLRMNGVISLAIPDKRVCFDFYRPHSTTGDFLEAYFDGRIMPTERQIFDQNSLRSVYRRDGQDCLGFSLNDDVGEVVAERQIDRAYREWVERRKVFEPSYIDTHCWVFTPSSFELALNDLYFLGLSDFMVEDVSPANNNEFYAHLRNVGGARMNEAEFYNQRQYLLRRISNELAENVLCSAGETRAQQLEASMHALMHSRSWRFTAPLRAIAGGIRRLING